MAAKKSAKSTFDPTTHTLVPKHEIVDDKEKKRLLDLHSAKPEDFPKILLTDPGISGLGAKEGDLIRITRNSLTAGSAVFYRVVVSE